MESTFSSHTLPACLEAWPECESGAYDPRCCRFPKSCSCTVFTDEPVPARDDRLFERFLRFGHFEGLDAWRERFTKMGQHAEEVFTVHDETVLEIVQCPLGRDCLGDGPSCFAVAEALVCA